MRDVAPTGQRGTTPLAVLGTAVIAAYLFGLGWMVENISFDIWGAALIAPLLFAITVPLARRVARTEADPSLVRIILWALALKLAASLVRYFVAVDLYGSADARSYAEWGTHLSELYRQGIFAVDLGRRVVGTGFIYIVTGVIFSFTGPTALGGFLVYSWLGFWGLYFFYRAFRISVDGEPRRYAYLVFFMPSLLFWPSSIGKESWMMLTLGLSAYGVARLLTRRRGAYFVLGLGLLGSAMVRPHMSALICAGLAVSYLLRRSARRSAFGPVTKVLGGVVIIVGCAVVLQQVEKFFGVEEEGIAGVESVLDESARRTDQGGSQFDAPTSRSPRELPLAVISVLFRPFPFEAHNVPALIASVEGTLLLALSALSWRRLVATLQHAWKQPYIAFAGVYALLFVVAFSTFGNFGILTRQRVQLYPLVLVFLALPRARDRVTGRVRN